MDPTQVASKAGLAKFRPLQASVEKNTKASTNLPNGWFYNEKQDDFWKNLESDPTFNPKLEQIKIEDQQHEFLNEMNDSSTKIKEIFDRFEDIDREALEEMSLIAEDDDFLEKSTASLLSDAKSNVTQYIVEMKELSESQTSLLDNLKIWFENLGKSEKFLNNEQEKSSDNIKKDEVIDFMSNYIHETEEKMEKAQNVHRDVSQFWVKQIAQFKKELVQKNSEISHLKESIEKIEASNNTGKTRRTPKKGKEKKIQDQSDPELINQLQNQIRTIEEQKNQIENLKNQLKSAQGQIGLSISNSLPSSEKLQLKMTEKENEIGRIKFEKETQIQMLQQRIQQLEKQNQRLQNDIVLGRDQIQFSENQLNNAKIQIKDLECSVQKYLKLLEFERNKPQRTDSTDSIVDTNNNLLLEERMLEIAQCKEEIRELKLKHKEELFEQAEILRSKFAFEKQQIFDSLESNDDQKLFKSIISEYENKLEEQRKNYDELKKNIALQWGGKLSLITHQYETRLKNQQASNEIALLKKKDEIQFEVKKAKFEIEDEFNKKVLQISQSYSNEMTKNEILTNRLKIQNKEMKKEISEYKEILNIKKTDENEINDEEFTNENSKNVYNPIENLLNGVDVVKTELNEQKMWELEQQKDYFTYQNQRTTEENQKELRKLLLSLQDSLSHYESEGENSITVEEALTKISDTIITLNSHCLNNEKSNGTDNDEKISLKKASERMVLLKNKIISLTSENNELRKGNPDSNLSGFDAENEQLKMKVKYLESLQKGDTDEAIKTLQKIEQELRMEIDVKDTIIDQLKAHIFSFDYENKIIFSKEPSDSQKVSNIQNDIININNEHHADRSSNNDVNIEKNKSKAITENQNNVNIDKSNQNDQKSRIISVSDDLNRNNLNCISLFKIEFTDGIVEIPLEYYEEEEELFENSETTNLENASSPNDSQSVNDQKMQESNSVDEQKVLESNSSTKTKALVKTKIKTVIREVPKIEYIEKSKYIVDKIISPLSAIEIFGKQPNLSFKNGQSMTLEFSSPSNDQIDVITKVVDEKQPDTTPTENLHESDQKQSTENIIKITDPSISSILHQKDFLGPNPFSLQKKEEEKQSRKTISFSRQNQIIKITDDLPIPPPNSPNLIYDDAAVQTDKELIESHTSKRIITTKASLFISSPLWQTDIPNRIVSIVNKAIRVIRRNGPMVISDYNVCTIEPHPPAPIVIAADEETKEKIEVLQEQFRLLSSSNKEQKIRNDLLRQIPEVNVFFRDRTIKFKNKAIESLQARVNATEDQLKRIREQKLLDIRRKSRAFYSVPRGNISGPLIVDPISNESTPKLKIAASSSVAGSGIKVSDENKPIASGSSGPVIPSSKKTEVKFEGTDFSDPMVEIIRILQCNTNFLTNQIEIGQQIINEFDGDINSFESFLKATKNFDDNSKQFINQLKQNQKLISDYHSQLEPLNVRQNQVLSMLKNMKENGMKKEVELTDSEKLNQQQKILDDIQKKTENSELSVDPTLIIERIQAALKTIDEIGLNDFNEEENRTLRTIRYKVKQFQTQLSNNEKIDSSELDSVLMETLSFISGIKAKILSKQSSEENQNLLSENEKLKSKIHKIKKARNAAEKELTLLKDKEISFETQINLLKSRLSEQQEIAENSASLYFAQMASLKSIVSQMSNGDQNNSDFIKQIKNEIFNLQTISETAVHEKELYKQKANEAEDRLVQTDVEKATAIRELNELQAKYEKLDAIVKKAYEEKLFYESDITKIKTEKAIEIEAKMKLKEQISQLIEENEKINEVLKKKREKVKVLKKQIESLKSENDELAIQATFGFYRRREIPKTSKSTQTMFVKIKKRNNENCNNNSEQQNNQVTKIENSNEKRTNNVVFEINQTPITSNTNNENENELNQVDKITSEEEEKIMDENEPVNFDNQESNSKLSKISSENVNSQNSLTQSDSSLSSTQFEWQEKVDQDTYNDSVLQTERTNIQTFESIEKGERVPIVHSPLKIKKKKATIVQQPQKTYMSPKSNKTRPKTVIHASRTQINSEELTIGSVTPGKRQLTGATQSPKPILPAKLQYGNTGIQILKPLEPLESAMTTINYEDQYASTVPASPKARHNSPLLALNKQQRRAQPFQQQPFVTEAENGLSETVRITKYDVEGGNQNTTPKTPIIAPKYSEQQQTSSSQQLSQFQPKMAEVHKIMVRLREKLLKLQTKLDKKADIITDLKKKLSEAVSENKQQRYAIIKAEDESKRAVHRFDSLKVRYDIIFKELASKEEDLSDCKREIYELRKIAAPAASSLSRLKNAQDEQLRILHEKERQKGMISMAKTAIKKTTSSEVQSHLCMLMKNTQKSIARLEAKRRMWKEVEKKQVMGALGALSLIDDKKSLFSLKRSISTVYNSPFRSKLTQKNRYSSVDLKIADDLNNLMPEQAPLTPDNRSLLFSRNELVSNFTPVFAKQLENINRMKPELSQDEKKQIIRGNVQPELAARILATEKEREEQERINNVVITPVKK